MSLEPNTVRRLIGRHIPEDVLGECWTMASPPRFPNTDKWLVTKVSEKRAGMIQAWAWISNVRVEVERSVAPSNRFVYLAPVNAA